MNLIEQIKKDAIIESYPLGTTLRKLHLLALQLGDESTVIWVEKELEGYDQHESLPNYRIVEAELQGFYLRSRFDRPRWQWLSNRVPAEREEDLLRHRFFEGIPAIDEDLRSLGSKKPLKVPVPPSEVEELRGKLNLFLR